MSLFEIDFLKKMVTLLKEAFTFKKYKAMHPVLAVFTGIFMLPFVIASFVLTAILAVLCFLFTVFSTPIKYLHEIVTCEGKGVQHATQFIIYFISWPLVFFLYAMVAVLLLFIIPAYAALSVALYIWTLGGFKFHLFPQKADDISIEVNGRYCFLPLIFVIVGAIMMVLVPLVYGVVLFVDLWNALAEAYFLATFLGDGFYSTCLWLFNIFAALYSLIGFARNPKEKAIEEIPTEKIFTEKIFTEE